MLQANFTALCVIEAELMRSKFYIAGWNFDVFCSRDLDLDLMTFIYELNPYSLKMYRMSEN